MMRAPLLFLPVLLAAWPAMAGAETMRRFEVYPLRGADPIATEQAVRALTGEGDSVVPDIPHHRLLVMTTEERHRRIAALLDKLSVPMRNIRIDVSFRSSGTARESGFGLHGGGRLSTGPAGTHGTLRLKPELRQTETGHRGETVQTLLVAGGREGTLVVGEQVPYMEWLIEYGRHWGYIQGRARWESVGSRLVVQPTVLGEDGLVRIRLIPELSGWADGRPASVRFARAATEVVAADGQTVNLGGVNKDDSFYRRFLLGRSRGGVQETLDILLTPHIMDYSDP